MKNNELTSNELTNNELTINELISKCSNIDYIEIKSINDDFNLFDFESIRNKKVQKYDLEVLKDKMIKMIIWII